MQKGTQTTTGLTFDIRKASKSKNIILINTD